MFEPPNTERQLSQFLDSYERPGQVPVDDFATEFLLKFRYRADEWNKRDVAAMLRKRGILNRNGTVNIY